MEEYSMRRLSDLSAALETEASLGGTTLMIVDPQVDFHEGGSLAVPGALDDAERIAHFIANHLNDIDELVVTLDSHHRLDIAHPMFWTDGSGSGSHPAPFTLITSEDIQQGTWVPVQGEHKEHCLEYTRQLEKGGKFTLCVWPEHCLIGTPGHSVHPVVNEAIQEWAVARRTGVTYVHKGQHPLTEHYSCFAAEVPVQGDEANDKGRAVLAKLCARDRVLVCGQASSHCVNFSARDLAAAWKRTTTGALEDEIARRRMGSLVLLKDGMSPVPGFEVGGQNCFSSCESHFMILWLTSFISLPLMLVGLSSETRMAPTRTHNTHARE
ncbi:unnamed protein product [Pylaiella littoralis]